MARARAVGAEPHGSAGLASPAVDGRLSLRSVHAPGAGALRSAGQPSSRADAAQSSAEHTVHCGSKRDPGPSTVDTRVECLTQGQAVP